MTSGTGAAPIRKARKEAEKVLNDRRDLLKAIAEGLDSWAIIEAHLCSIFAIAVTASNYSAAAAAFSAVLGFEAQLRMADAAMRRSFPTDGDRFSEWKAIKKALDRLRPERNKLAHGKVVPVVIRGGEQQWRYLPFYHFFTHKERDEFEHMTVDEIDAVNVKIRGAVVSMADFGKKIGARQEIKGGKILPGP